MTVSIPMLDLVRLHREMENDLFAAFREVLSSGRFIGGHAVERFEESLEKELDVRCAVGVSSGTDALLVLMMALGVRPSDEIVTTPYTFFATAGCIARLGAKPVFVDIDPATFNIDPSLISAAITERTVGIMPVHLFGQCADMDPILDIAKSKGIWVLEDAAQAIGSVYRGRKIANMGVAGALSFFPSKNLGGFGDGGAVATKDPVLADRVRSLRQHGARIRYQHSEVGGNFRLDALQAALLQVKLPYLKRWEDGRRAAALRYNDLLSNVPGVSLPAADPAGNHVYNQYVIRLKNRDEAAKALAAAGIGCAIYYPTPLHLQDCFQYLGYKEGQMPESERASRESLAIPMDPLIEESAQQEVAKAIAKAAGVMK